MTLNKLTSDALADNTIDNDSIANNSIPIDKLSNVNLAIAPEVLTIDVAAPAAGQDTQWLWNWLTSSLPYARREITNSNELNVPLYKQGTYTVNNFAKTQYGSMTQPHTMHFKWIDGAGTQNNISWVTDQGTFTDSHPDINGGANTTVQRLSISVPSVVTPPTLTAPSVTYGVSFVNAGAYTFSGPRDGDNPNIGPLRRGGTYTFNVNATGHPFYLTTDNGTNFSAGTYFGEYTSGVTNSRTDNGTVTFVVPANAPDTLYYQCGNHSSMRGAITIKDLAVETNINGNYVVYAQHTQEGHKTPVELRPIPSLVNQMCIVYDATTGQFVPQDLATYVENTPSFENKIREVAGTAELVVEDGSAVVAKVNVYADSTYLPLTDNNAGDQAFATDINKLYIWDGSSWQQAGAASTSELSEGTNLYYTNARADARAQLKIDALVDSAPGTLDTLNELAAALGDDANFSTTITNSIATKLPLAGGTVTGNLVLNSGLTMDGTGDFNMNRTDNDFSFTTSTAAQTANRGVTFQLAGGGQSSTRFKVHHATSQFTGNVGIGEPVPTAKLHIKPTAFTQPSLIIDTPSGYSEGDMYVLHGRDVNSGIGFSSTAFGVNVQPEIPSNNIPKLRSNTGGLTSAGLMYVGADEVSQGVFGVMGASGTAGTDLDHLFTVKSGGNIGIGTTNPNRKLTIAGGDSAKISFTGGGTQSLYFGDGAGAAEYAGYIHYAHSDDQMRFNTTTDFAFTGGNVGIGTDNPTELLYVNGSSRLGGGVDYGSTTILSVAPGTINFDASGVVGGRLTIQGTNGNVGINRPNPVSKLTVLDGVPGLESTSAGNISILYNGGENTYDRGGGIDFRQKWFSSSTDLVKTGMISGIKTYGNGNHGGGLSFYTKPHNGNNLQQTMVLSGHDRMGIGTQDPQAKLHVTAQTAVNLSSASTINGGSINTSTGDIVTGRIFWEGNSGSGTNVFGVNNESGGLVIYNYSTNRYQIAFNNGQNIVFGQQSAAGMYNGTGSNGFAVAQAGNGGQYVTVQNTSDSNIYLSKHSSYSDARVLQFSIAGTTKGSVTVASSGTTYNTTSDLRLKTDTKPIENATNKLLEMNPVEHKWKADPEDDAVHGFIAQEMKEIIPEAVYGEPDSDEMMSMDYGRITPVVVAALQDALNEIKELKTRINKLESNK